MQLISNIYIFCKSIIFLGKVCLASIFNELINKEACEKWFKKSGKITLVNYSQNKTKNSIENYTMYWGDLVKIFSKKKIKINIINIPIKDTIYQIMQTKKTLNKNINDINIFKFLNLEIFIQVVINQFKLLLKISESKNILEKFSFKNRRFSKIFLPEFYKSVLSEISIKGILYYFLFKKIFSRLNSQQFGFYPCEFQNWESSLCQNWKSFNHHNLFGYIHAGSRFWDLRYYFSKKHFKSHSDQFFPDKLLVHSYSDYDNLVKSGLRINKIKIVEPLRFKFKKNKKTTFNLECFTVGVFLDYDYTTSINMIRLIESKMLSDFQFLIKNHPALELISKKLSTKNNIKFLPKLNKIISNSDVFLVSISSSIIFQLLKTNKKVVFFCEADKINIGFFTNEKIISIASDASQLLSYLQNVNSIKNPIINNRYFAKRKKLLNWKNILRDIK